MRILIAVPTFENIAPETFTSIYRLNRGGHETIFEAIRGYDVATARNKIAQRALDLKTDYVLMVDSDVVLPKDALIHLLENAKDVCLGYCPARSTPERNGKETCISKFADENGKLFSGYPRESRYMAAEFKAKADAGVSKLRVRGGGSACALIRTDVFKRLPYPWYDWVNYPGEQKAMLSEDLYFCTGCRKAGIDIYVDCRVGCGHIFRYVQYPECE